MFACRRGTPVEQAPAPAAVPARTSYATGDAVVAAMRDRYEGKWYRTLTFVQKTSRLQADGKWSVQDWYESMHTPGRLRIDFAPLGDASGVIYARDSVFTVSKGRALPGQKSINPLLVLGFDVYTQPSARTAALLRQEGFDLARTSVDTFERRPMIVVGARRGETTRKQFWIDAEHLYFVRMLEPTRQDPKKVQDIRFLKYERLGEAWIAPRVEIYNDGKLVMIEEYRDIRPDVTLDPALFDPTKWKTARHWFTP